MTDKSIDDIFGILEQNFAAIEEKYGTATRPDQPRFTVIVNEDPDPAQGAADPSLDPVNSDPEEAAGDLGEQVAALNDRFRRAWPERDPELAGFTHISPAVMELGDAVEAELRRSIAQAEDFDDVGCPLHDYGQIKHQSAGDVLWTIETFENADCKARAEYPEDPGRSYRILMIFLASEAA
ncbi:MAG: DUF3768 domain-containing protein [Gammaproteobacteria bacterium]